MKWLKSLIDQRISIEVKDLSEKFRALDKSVSDMNILFLALSSQQKELRSTTSEVSDKCSLLNKEILRVEENASTNDRRINIKINESERLLKDELETSIIGLTKIIDDKIGTLGDKRGIVTDLLKKIAKLES